MNHKATSVEAGKALPSRGSSALQKELAALLSEKQKRISSNKLKSWKPWPKQKEFAESKERVVAMMGGNRVGKSQTCAYVIACHATGLYPDDWNGNTFDEPPQIWCAGITSQSTRDIIQVELLGDIAVAMGTGMIPKDLIVGTRRLQGTNDAIDTIYVRHVPSGGISAIGLKSMEQGRAKFQGTARHIIWLDEEAIREGYDIFSECKLRTMTIPNGQVLVTYTPLQGNTELCKYILDKNGDGVHMVNITWDDAPHLDEATRKKLESEMLPHEIEARKLGRPVIKEGLIYPFPESNFVVEPFPVPSHWGFVIGMDVAGYNGMTAAVLIAYDYSTDIAYVVDEYCETMRTREEHIERIKKWGRGIYVACDPSANRTEVDGTKTIKVYRKLGLNIFNADNDVSEGITRCFEMYSAGKLKIFSTCRGLIEELRFYQYGNDGKPKKKNDHRLDSKRYGVMALGKARTKTSFARDFDMSFAGSLNVPDESFRPGDAVVGY